MKGWLLVAVVAYALAGASVVHATGCTQTSHYALVRAFAAGTAEIDPWHAETCDKAWSGGHFYSVKGPALAALVLPYYLGLRAAHALPGNTRDAIWALGLLGAVLPGAALLALMRRAGDGVSPGTGLPAAVAVGLGTMLLPFSTVLFAHVLAGALAFAAFAVLLAERRRRQAGLLVAAGLIAGLAALAEYPAGLAAVLLAGLAAAPRPRLRRLAAYAGGLAIPFAALLAYDRWAFGSFTHVSYTDTVLFPGETGHDVVGGATEGFFGVSAPSLRIALELLLSHRGVLVTTPLVGVAVAGLVLLFRAGRRAEALTAGLVAGAFLVYNAGIRTTFGGPFGGDSPGPRYLVIALPFLVLGVAAAMRRAPATTAALGAVSVLAMVAATLTGPLLEPERGGADWLERVTHGDFERTLLTWAAGSEGWLATLPFLALVAVVAAAGLRGTGAVTPSNRAVLTAAGALLAWALVAGTTPELLEESAVEGSSLPLAAAAVFAAAAVLLVVHVERGTFRAAVAVVPLGLGYLEVDSPALVLGLAAAALTFLAVASRLPRRARRTLPAELQREVDATGLSRPLEHG